jgi:hypothetical protein
MWQRGSICPDYRREVVIHNRTPYLVILRNCADHFYLLFRALSLLKRPIDRQLTAFFSIISIEYLFDLGTWSSVQNSSKLCTN